MTATTPPWEAQESFSAASDYDMTGAPNRASALSTLSISHLPFVLFSAPGAPGYAKARYSTKSLLPSDVGLAFPSTPVTPPPPLPMIRQATRRTLAQPPITRPLPARTPSNPGPRPPRPRPSALVLPAGPSLPRLPKAPPMATPAVPVQAALMGRPPPHTGSVSGPRVRPLPQRPPTAKPIDDERLWPARDGKIGRSNSTPADDYHSELDSNALRRNRHIRRAQKAALNGPRPLPPLPGTSPATSIILMGPHNPTSKRVSSPTQPAPPRILTVLHRSKSDPTSPPPHLKPSLSLVIPKSQADSRARHVPQQEPRPTAPSSDDESFGPHYTKSRSHSLHYFPTINYASVATPSAVRPPPSAHPEGGKDNSNLLDWHLLEEALGIDGDSDADVLSTASPVMVSFLPSPDAPPVPAIPDRFLIDPSAQSLEDTKSRRAVDSILAMVVDYEHELLYQFPIPPTTI